MAPRIEREDGETAAAFEQFLEMGLRLTERPFGASAGGVRVRDRAHRAGPLSGGDMGQAAPPAQDDGHTQEQAHGKTRRGV